MKEITGEQLGGLLFGIHSHDEESEKIIYYEEDLLPILKFLGLPEPIWGKAYSIKDLIDIVK